MTAPADPGTGGSPAREWRPRANPWIITTAVMLATFMEVLDTSIAVVALPHIAGNLSASTDEATWVLTSYLVANAVILPASGWLAAYFGRKRFLIACIAIFMASSFACGTAASLGLLVAARIFQGAGGGALQPISQAILLESFPPEKRGMAMAAFGLGVVVAPIIGPTLGGWLTDNYSWRWAFYINIPVGVAAILMTRAFVEDPPYIRNAKAGKIDTLGFGLMAVSIGTLQIILDKGQQAGWFDAPWIRWFAILCAATMAAFLLRELRVKEPIVNLRVLRNRNFAVGTLLITLMGIALYGMLTLQPLFLQTLLGYTALQSGLAVSPRGLGALLMMPLIGYLTNVIDKRAMIGFGFLLFGATSLMLGNVNLQVSMSSVVWPIALSGIASALIWVPLATVTMGTLSREEMGNATGIFNLMRNIGGSIGISVVATMLVRDAQAHQANMVMHLAPNNPVFHSRFLELQGAFLTRFGPIEASRKAMGTIYGELLRQANLWSFVDNFRFVAWVCLACFIAIFLLEKAGGGRAIGVH
jgi:DHA2 family multidrug resistance protein